MAAFEHIPVMMEEVLHWLDLKPGMTVVDCTAGGGGHSAAMLARVQPKGFLIALDQDQQALEAADHKLEPFGKEAYALVHSNFLHIAKVMEDYGQADAILMDLGVSSYQLDEGERGFSYQHDGPLDMRMNQQAPIPTAADLLNELTEADLSRVIWEYGEERWSKRIARFIVQTRLEKPFETTQELVRVIKQAVPSGARQDGPHPAKRTFQALRIAVNGELSLLDKAVEDAVNLLKPGGRLAVITFHSLEDRKIKGRFRQLAQGCTCPKNLPVCQCQGKSVGKVLTGKPVLPSEDEVEHNPRSRSAKLRVFLKHK